MSDAAPPFDPSKPFTVEGGGTPPPFDPSKPFTTEGTTTPSAPRRESILGSIAGTTAVPLANLLTEPVRATAADIVATQFAGGIPTTLTDPAARERWQKMRAASLEASTIPGETSAGTMLRHGVERGISAIGSLTPPALAYRNISTTLHDTFGLDLDKALAPLGPAATIAGDVGALGAGMVRGNVPSEPKAGPATTFTEFADAITKDSPARLESTIKRLYNTAVAPPKSAAKGSATGRADYEAHALDAMRAIVANEPNLRFLDNGVEVVGQAPRSMWQFEDGISQTLRPIFEFYNGMAERAGLQGAKIDLAPAVQELRAVATTPRVVDMRPEVANYATGLANRLEARGSYSTIEAQDSIAQLNQELKAFYDNPNARDVARTGVDAMVANLLREGTDRAIAEYQGPGYQEFKNQYGALKTIQKHVSDRATVLARQQPGGGLIGRLGDVASAGEFLHGIFTMSAADMLSGAALKGVVTFANKMRSPNRAVAKMFDTVKKLPDQPQSMAGPATSSMTGGMQPPRPSGPAQNATGGTSTGVASGGAALEAMGLTPQGVIPARPDPFLTPVGGGVVQ